MKYRSLGTSGLLVSEIGFGAWGIGGTTANATSYGHADDATSLRALAEALDRGITFFDTAPAYGDGHSETLIGIALRGRSDVVVASKCGLDSFSGASDTTPMGLRRSLEASLRRLGRQRLDLLQLHSPPPSLLALDSLRELMNGWRSEGLIGAFGVSVKSPADGITALEKLAPEVLQVNFNLTDQRALESGLLDACLAQGVGVIARTPLCFGFLAGTLSVDAVFAEDDHRSRWPREQIELWARANRGFATAIAGQVSCSPAQLALRFCLSHPAIATTIPGMMSAAEVIENAAASDMGVLDTAQMDQLFAVYRDNTYFVSRA